MSLNIQLLEQSFGVVKAHSSDFTQHFYSTLFTDHPEIKPLFAQTNMKEQGDHLYKSLVFVVANLRDPDILSSTLKGLGTRHVQYGTLPHHYPIVGNSLLKSFEKILGTAWTPEVRQAWVDAYGAVTKLMLEGADYPSDTLNLNRETQT